LIIKLVWRERVFCRRNSSSIDMGKLILNHEQVTTLLSTARQCAYRLCFRQRDNHSLISISNTCAPLGRAGQTPKLEGQGKVLQGYQLFFMKSKLHPGSSTSCFWQSDQMSSVEMVCVANVLPNTLADTNPAMPVRRKVEEVIPIPSSIVDNLNRISRTPYQFNTSAERHV